jgi:DNA invertase Pin-like site-specific DNA recombinase
MIRRDGKAGGKIRCAIYTRKSTEEGLDQEFNSLDAQREACAAYILSQRHEGWTLVPEHYDDGGFTGGNMERPGLRQILADVKAGRVDVIVVYKVDRLTRALSDFAKIVDVLDAAGASFVSITQAFNTTTSMGRLTLNVLLSFAQFEREVISERVRDKIAASKRKGMWMGGNVPLGYDVRDRKLIVNEREARTVRHIFQRYIELGNVRQLIADLRHDDIRTKLHHAEDGTTRGGRPFTAGPLYHILSNRIYRGEVIHKGEVHAGEHEAIISDDLWDEVQNNLTANRVIRKHQSNASDPSLLAGMIHDGEGRRMTPSHASKNGVRYRYYVSVDGDTTSGVRPIRIAAADIERGGQTGAGEVARRSIKPAFDVRAHAGGRSCDRRFVQGSGAPVRIAGRNVSIRSAGPDATANSGYCSSR